MKTLHQSLQDYPLPRLVAIAETRGVTLGALEQRAAVDQLGAALADPRSIVAAVSRCSVAAQGALRELRGAGGRMVAPTFERTYGTVRHFGPGRLAEEAPWRDPSSVAEELWYSGLIARGFAPLDQGTAEYIFVPSDVLPHLPLDPSASQPFRLAPVEEPLDIQQADDSFVEDACTLLSFVHEEGASVDHRGHWRMSGLTRFNERLRRPARLESFDPVGSGESMTLLLHLAKRVGWIEEQRRRPRLVPSSVQFWLRRPRREQVAILWAAWRDSPDWDDLCRSPGLRCEGTWKHDPLRARQRVLHFLAQCEPDMWYNVGDFAAAVKRTDPDFQRPDGHYRSWYVRHESSGRYLTGFEDWELVEGSLIAYILSGPAHWLGAVDLGQAQAPRPDVTPVNTSARTMPSTLPLPGAGVLFRLNTRGAALLGCIEDASHDPSPPLLSVLPDFTIVVPEGFPCLVRFQLARFTTWEASLPVFRYRLTQRSLRRAQERGITIARAAAFLRRVSGSIPPNVGRALSRLEE